MKTDRLRITHQREIILEELRSVTSHPTADELYTMVRLRLPRISLATVYRNLEWLAENGIVQKIEVGGRQKRFDGTTSEHYHIRCLNCGKVDDVSMSPVESLENQLEQSTGYKILGHRIEFKGLCPSCKPSDA
jgi:Fur family ferric uptake transcriptional regulator